MVLNEEQVAFSDWINQNLGKDEDVHHHLPLNVSFDVAKFYPSIHQGNFQETGSDMYEKMDDGIILCKMVNLAALDTIDERVINKGNKLSIFKVRLCKHSLLCWTFFS